MIRAIVFDFNGIFVLAPEPRVIERLCRAYGTGKWIALSNYVLLIRRFERGLMPPMEFWSRVITRLTKEDFAMHVEGEYANPPERNEGMFALAQKLSENFPLYCISNSNFTQGKAYRRQKLYAAFKKLYLSHETGHLKPSPAAFTHFLKDSGLKAFECVFIDDSPANVAIAKLLGFRAILYRGNKKLVQKLAKMGLPAKLPADAKSPVAAISSGQQ
ncbi:MAG TPA: HAD family phosphatase [Candidatus Diapherotrites archaeon]|uniref:HAD family phosphatase n=1 Tax=Candidatus Iainarchaeum sp. TaxID=3101447 RepID=A0A7J4IWV3_9ARCH|nr:HAD family phosphatase [Candidatus Diapherotrites archaeon]